MSDRNHRIVIVGALGSCFAIAACGGGGSGGSQSSPPPSPPPPPTFNTPIDLTNANAVDAMLEFGVSIDTVYLVSMAATRRIAESAEKDFESSLDNCGVLPSDGTRLTTFIDNDGDAVPNSGDRFVIEYFDGCYDSIADRFLFGTITVDVTEMSLGNAMGFAFSGRLTYSPNMMVGVPNYERHVSGTVLVELFNAGDAQVFEAQIPDGGSIRYSYESRVNGYEGSADGNITSFSAKRVGRIDAERLASRVFSFSADIESSLLGGKIHCESRHPISQFDGLPGSGDNIECFGARGSSAVGRIYKSGPQREFVDIFVDDSGDGDYSYLGAMDSFRLWLEDFRIASVPGYSNFADSLDYEPVTHNRVLLDSLDSAHDATNGYLYVLGPTDLVVLSDSTLSELNRIVLAENYNTLALSDSGATIWLAVADKPELHAFDTVTLQRSSTISYTAPAPGANVNYVEQLSVVPGSEDHVIALINPRLEITSFRLGSELPATISMGSAFPQSFVVADAQTLYTSTGNRHPQEDLIEVLIDPVQGLSSQQVHSGYLGDGFGMGLYFSDGEIIGNNGRAISAERDTVAGVYDSFTVPTTGFVASSTLDRVFAIRNVNQIHVYRRASRSLVGTYRLDDPSFARFRRSHLSGDNLLLTFADMVVGIPLANMPDNVGSDACKTEDFSGLAAPGEAFQLTCLIESATFDVPRDRLYLGISPGAGGAGNSIISVNPNTGLVDATVVVGSRPGKTRISSDGAVLYVTLPDANELLEVSLPAFELLRRQSLGLQRDYSFARDIPAFPVALDVTGLGPDDLVISMSEGDLFHYMNGTQLPNRLTARRSFHDLHLALDGTKGVAIEPGESQLIGVDASGVASRSFLGSLFDGHPVYQTPVMRAGDELFKFDGDIFDLESESLSNPCNRTVPDFSTGAAAPAPAGDSVTYYLIDVSVHTLSTCDRGSGVSTQLPPPVFFGFKSQDLLGAFHTQNNMLVLVSQQAAIIRNAQP